MSIETKTASQLSLDVITSEAHLTQLSDLLDRAFSTPQGTHYYDDFPVWSPKSGIDGNSLLRIGIFDGEKLVSTLSIRLASLKVPTGRITVGLIGAVATEPEYRGKGLASQAVALATKWAESRGARLLILWGSEYQLYQRLGFELCGQQLRVPLKDLGLARSLIKVHTGWVPGIFDRLKSRPSGLAVTELDIRWLTAHKNVQWFWTGTAEKVQAYAAIGRGIDLQNLVHEWGGDAAGLRAILSQIQEKSPDAALLGSPELISEHGFGLGQAPLEFLCLARILDPTRVFLAYHPLLPFRAENLEGGWTLTMNGLTIPSLSEGELTRMFFGPDGSPVAGGRSSKILPLPLWIWGLDGA